eukprot:COSAG01_NODE_7157_length_3325_cov_11.382207_2_plen_242_part_00
MRNPHGTASVGPVAVAQRRSPAAAPPTHPCTRAHSRVDSSPADGHPPRASLLLASRRAWGVPNRKEERVPRGRKAKTERGDMAGGGGELAGTCRWGELLLRARRQPLPATAPRRSGNGSVHLVQGAERALEDRMGRCRISARCGRGGARRGSCGSHGAGETLREDTGHGPGRSSRRAPAPRAPSPTPAPAHNTESATAAIHPPPPHSAPPPAAPRRRAANPQAEESRAPGAPRNRPAMRAI